MIRLFLAEDRDDILYLMDSLITEYKKRGQEINVEKTPYMVLGGKREDLETSLGTEKHSDEFK